jgi:hypothetical protein
MTGLERRLARLETVAGVTAEIAVLFVGFGGPDGADPPATKATVNGVAWHRADDETKETFLARVKAEARPLRPGCGIVGFLE